MKKLTAALLLLFSFNASASVVVLVDGENLPQDFVQNLESKIVQRLTAQNINAFMRYEYLEGVREKLISAMKTGGHVESLVVPFGDVIAVCRIIPAGKDTYSIFVSLIDTVRGEVVATTHFQSSEDTLVEKITRTIAELLNKLPPKKGFQPEENEEWEVVKVIAEGRIKGADSPAVRRAALVVALRNAVEKSAGISAHLKRVLDERKVTLSSASRRVAYRILSEDVSDGYYTVKIQADVYVKKEAGEKKVLPLPEGTESVIFKVKGKGFVDWGRGYVEAEGTGIIPRGKRGFEIAKRAAFANAVGNAFEVIKGININEKEKIKGFISKDSKRAFEIAGVISNAEIVEIKREGKRVKVRIRVPLEGIRNVVLTYIAAEAPSKKTVRRVKKAEKPRRKKTVIVDARGVKVKPVLLPKISSSRGKSVKYSSVAYVKPGKKRIRFTFKISEKGKVPSEIVIGERDAEKIKKELGDTANIIILTDEVVGGTEG